MNFQYISGYKFKHQNHTSAKHISEKCKKIIQIQEK